MPGGDVPEDDQRVLRSKDGVLRIELSKVSTDKPRKLRS